MLQSKLFYKTNKPDKNALHNLTGENLAISSELLENAGFVDQLMAGVYSFMPLGFLVLKNIENIIRKNMVDSPMDGQEIVMPSLTPKENWVKTGRWDNFDVLFKLKGAGDKDVALAPTHEEVVVPLAKKFVFSYKDLPFSLFQFQNKFRNELRAKSGILRTREFLMKDLYSFHANQEDLDKYYDKAIKVYFNIFKECGIGKLTYRTLASGGNFSKYSDEFQTITDVGEDIIYICQKCKVAINKEIKEGIKECPNCKNNFSAQGGPAVGWEEKKAIEVGNIFKLGTKFSIPFDLKYTDKDGTDKSVIMGCYGIGLGRLMGTIVEVNHDDRGIIWPKEVAPFLVHLIELKPASRQGGSENKKVKATALKIYQDLQKQGVQVIYDDRQDKSAGEKFAEADLIGIPYRVVVSEKTLAKNSVELKERSKSKIEIIKIKQIVKKLKNGE
jgi:prolyl-tRNA synthetase